MKLKEEDVPEAILPREKPVNTNPCASVVQLKISVSKQTYIFSLHWYVLPLVLYKMPDQGSSWSYLCTKVHSNLHARAPSHNLRLLFHVSPCPHPTQSHKVPGRLVRVPGYHSFSKWAIEKVLWQAAAFSSRLRRQAPPAGTTIAASYIFRLHLQ